MKKIFAASLIGVALALLLWRGAILVARADKTENDLIKETVLLSKRVKQFEKTLGVTPGPALVKSIEEQPASSMMLVFFQKKCTLALYEPHDVKLRVHFSVSKEEIPIQELAVTAQDSSSFVRRLNAFSDSRSVITPDFAKLPQLRKVEVAAHEDLHGTIRLPLEQEEAIVTPLAYLVAREFFKSVGDKKQLAAAEKSIADMRVKALEMHEFVAGLQIIFKETPCHEARKRAYSSLNTFRRYKELHREDTTGQNDMLEAKVSMDFHYWKYFDTIISLSELGVPLKTLIHDLKKSPATHPEITQYFQKLKERYRKQYNR